MYFSPSVGVINWGSEQVSMHKECDATVVVFDRHSNVIARMSPFDSKPTGCGDIHSAPENNYNSVLHFCCRYLIHFSDFDVDMGKTTEPADDDAKCGYSGNQTTRTSRRLRRQHAGEGHTDSEDALDDRLSTETRRDLRRKRERPDSGPSLKSSRRRKLRDHVRGNGARLGASSSFAPEDSDNATEGETTKQSPSHQESGGGRASNKGGMEIKTSNGRDDVEIYAETKEEYAEAAEDVDCEKEEEEEDKEDEEEEDNPLSRIQPKSDRETTRFHPVSVLDFDEKGKLHVNEAAKRLLEHHHRPLCVINCAGKARTGKSHLLNTAALGLTPEELANPNCGFQVSSKHQSCTKGIWFHGEPMTGDEYFRRLGVERDASHANAEVQDFDVLVVDTEGIGALDRETGYDMRILTIALLTTSLFVFNSKNAIDEDALNTLTTIVSTALSIQQTNEGAVSAPGFLWVVRDFGLDLDGMTDDQYLEQALRVTPTMDRKKAALRENFKRFFRTRGCRTVSAPDRDKTKQLSFYPLDALHKEFRRDIHEFRRVLPYALRPVQMFGEDVTGSVLLELLHQYVDAINANRIPVVRDSWEQVAEQRARGAIEDGVGKMKALVGRAESYVTPAELLEATSAVRLKAFALFRERAMCGNVSDPLKAELQSRLEHEEECALEQWMNALQRMTPPMEPITLDDAKTGEGQESEQLAAKQALETWKSRMDVLLNQTIKQRVGEGASAGTRLMIDTLFRGSVWSQLPEIIAFSDGLFGQDAPLSSRRRMDEALSEATQKYEEEAEKLRGELSDALKEQSAAESRSTEVDRELETAKADVESYKQTLQEVRSELERLAELEARVEVLTEERQLLRVEVEEGGKTQRKHAQELEAQLHDERVRHEDEMDEYQQDMQDQLAEANHRAETAETQVAQQRQKWEQERVSLESKLSVLAGERDSLRDQVTRQQETASSERRRCEERMDELRNAAQHANEERITMSRQLHDQEMMTMRTEMQLEAAQREIQSLQASVQNMRELKEENERVQNSLSRAQGEAKALRDEREDIVQRMNKSKEAITALRGQVRTLELQLRDKGGTSEKSSRRRKGAQK